MTDAPEIDMVQRELERARKASNDASYELILARNRFNHAREEKEQADARLHRALSVLKDLGGKI
jgi:hypothetical protein